MQTIIYVIVAIVVLGLLFKILNGLLKFVLAFAFIVAAAYIYFNYFSGLAPA
ncbi:MAG: hypothetical protein IKP81_01030 [Paludibacteraceae bacterium]|nr:hypothetical protein [Paludibacteraceae bacterium]MBQ4036376.1 hypothetical protein [Paludibacteraceae bacterium]MBR6042718.1 hypothetical protein [Paludibacteraceae bacterium]MBR6103625.1 hypothetical protein [Paludibacteraceae bacterium]